MSTPLNQALASGGGLSRLPSARPVAAVAIGSFDFMKTTLSLLLTYIVYGLANADEMRVYSKEPVVVDAPSLWKSTKDKPPNDSFPFETYRLVPPSNRNAQCLISI